MSDPLSSSREKERLSFAAFPLEATWKPWLTAFTVHPHIHATYLLSTTLLGIVIGLEAEQENRTHKVISPVKLMPNSKQIASKQRTQGQMAILQRITLGKVEKSNSGVLKIAWPGSALKRLTFTLRSQGQEETR